MSDWGEDPSTTAGYMQPPTAQQYDAQRRTIPSSTVTASRPTELQDPGKMPERGDIYTLPVSVMSSPYWTLPEQRLTFVIREPRVSEVTEMARASTPDEQAVPRFIMGLGTLGSNRGEDGHFPPAKVGYPEAQAWLAALPMKARMLVTELWSETFQPTVDEKNALRASRKAV